ncbi:helix-turn-helix domain-containing protein [Cohnella algarum]|uniref:helix-turn-helix domain-containing protein n=1 Tax=Cohnella algarum TaxID=2044859 RepID=UPI001967C643|nr:helix-turn-helix transcriptional regulator [Cohnella algarum]
MESLGSRIKKLRKERGLTQDDIGRHLGMGRSNVGHIENGRTIPTSETLDKIANILGTTTDYLLGRSNDPHGKPYYSLTDKDDKDIARKLEAMMNELESDSALAFMGEPMDEEDRELLRISLENTLRMSREMAKKKFTPKKYRN